MSPIPASAVSLLRRFTALLVTLLLIQANWQESGAACVIGHAASHHEVARHEAASTTDLRTGGAVAAHEAKANETKAHAAMAHDGPRLRWALGDAESTRASSPTGPEETLPSHCPDSGMPPDCAAMMACSSAAVATAAGPLLATEGIVASERVIAPDARPHSRHTAPDVPPPRA